MAEKGEQHVPALDGLRGIAILFVLIAHFRLASNASLTDHIYNVTAAAGYSGVDLFFVLSGFLITGILLDAKTRGRHTYFRNFYARRALRILPLYYGFIAFLILVWPRIHAITPPLVLLQHNQWWYWLHATNFLWATSGAAALPYNTGHFWSLAVEEQFYLVWPVVVLLCSERQLLRVCIGCVVGALLLRIGMVIGGVSDFWIYALPVTRMDTLACGAALAVVARSPEGVARYRGLAGPVALGAAVAWGALYGLAEQWPAIDPLFRTVGYSAAAAMYGGALVLAVTAPAGAVVASPFLRFFGKYSYGMYVLHEPLLAVIRPWLTRATRVPTLFGTLLPAQAVYFVLATAATAAAAFVCWHVYERPFLSLKRFFPRTDPVSAQSGSAHSVRWWGSAQPDVPPGPHS